MLSNRHSPSTGAIALVMLATSACSTMSTATAPTEFLPEHQNTAKAPIPHYEARDPVFNILVAEIAAQRGQTSLAVDNYLRVLEQYDSAELAERAVRLAIFDKNPELALQAARRWTELQPDNMEARQVRAALAIRTDQQQEALENLEWIIQKVGVEEKGGFLLALNLLSREENGATVLELLQSLREKYPDNAYSHYIYGVSASRQGEPQKALEGCDRALELAEIPDAFVIKAKALIELKQPQEALKVLELALATYPEKQQIRLSYARLLVDERQYEKALEEFRILHEHAPSDSGLLYTLGLLSLESGQYPAAEGYFQSLLESGKRREEARYYLGRLNEIQGRLAEAVVWYQKVDDGEYQLDARLRQASLTADLGQIDKAEQLLSQLAIEHQSDAVRVRIYLLLGEIYREHKMPEKAVEAYSEGLNIVPGNNDLLYVRALAYEELANLDAMAEDIQAILRTEPDNAHALNAYGFALTTHTDRLEEAFDYLSRAIELAPEEPAIIDSLGWVNYRMGRYVEAKRLLRKALNLLPDSEIAAHLGEVLWVTGEREAAQAIWQKALQQDPESEYIQEVLQRFKP